jgi:hypothetical protein
MNKTTRLTDDGPRPSAWFGPDGSLHVPFDAPVDGHVWATIQWPPCTVCGAPVFVDRVSVQTSRDPVPVYIAGLYECTVAAHNPAGRSTT